MQYHSGLHDPYQYEYLVGLNYVLDMLHPDNNIANVGFQVSGVDVVDDILISYQDGSKHYIQAKYSINDELLKFSDFISLNSPYAKKNTKEEKTFLGLLAKGWLKEYNKNHGKILVSLQTNKLLNNQSSVAISPVYGEYSRPSLTLFYKILNEISQKLKNLDEFAIDGYEEACKEWLLQLDPLSDAEKIEFIKSFSIISLDANIESLEIIIKDKISKYFGTEKDGEQTSEIFRKLYTELKYIVTTRRVGDAIDAETVFKLLSDTDAQFSGIHDLVPPYPFFTSRKQIIEDIEEFCVNPIKPVLFLSGKPGAGKTSIVSKLVNKVNSKVDFRFHAFRPIQPNDDIIPDDYGRTVTPHALWGDILKQIRKVFAGELYKYQVPISSSFLSSNELQEQVVRLLKSYSEKIGRKVIVAIDGIDHAARASSDGVSTFLQSLIAPDKVPGEIAFIIVGQPVEMYQNYPVWLKNDSELIERFEVPNLGLDDIRLLLETKMTAFESINKDALVQLIFSKTNGNTLSVVYACEEARQFAKYEDFEAHLDNRQLGSDLDKYYENIWSVAIAQVDKYLINGNIKMATFLSVFKSEITADKLNEIFNNVAITKEDWESFLFHLSPLFIKINEGYLPFHNDLRVYLTSIVKTEQAVYNSVLNKICEYYLQQDLTCKDRYFHLIDYLIMADRGDDLPKVFDVKFCMESIYYKVPLAKLQEQSKKSFESAINLLNWDMLHSCVCVGLTLEQLFRCLEGTEVEYIEEQDNYLFDSEKRTIPISLWNFDTVRILFHEIEILYNKNEHKRVCSILDNWFSEISFNDLINAIDFDDKYRETHMSAQFHENDEEKEFELLETFQWILETLGKLSSEYKLPFTSLRLDNETLLPEHIVCSVNSGKFKVIPKMNNTKKLLKLLDTIKIFNLNDFDDCIKECMLLGNYKNAEIVIRTFIDPENKYPAIFLLKIIFYSCLLRNSKTTKILKERFIDSQEAIFDELIKNKEYALNHIEESNLMMFIFIYGTINTYKDTTAISTLLNRYKDSRTNNRSIKDVFTLANIAYYLGQLTGMIHSKDFESISSVPQNEILLVLRILLQSRRPVDFYQYDNIRKYLFGIFLKLTENIGDQFIDKCIREIDIYLGDDKNVFLLKDIWEYKASHSSYSMLHEWFLHWCSTNGAVWDENFEERYEIINGFCDLSIGTDWEEEAKETLELLHWSLIGYSGHKDYTYGSFIEILENLSNMDQEELFTRYKYLLCLSRKASILGDNRYSSAIERQIYYNLIKNRMYEFLFELYTNESILNFSSRSLPEAIAKYVKEHHISEDELTHLFMIINASTFWQLKNDEDTLIDAYKAIYQTCISNSYHKLISRINIDYAVEENISKRPVESRSSVTEPDESIDDIEITLVDLSIYDVIEGMTNESRKFNLLEKVLDHVVSEKPANFNSHIEQIYSLIANEDTSYRWSHSSEGRIVSKLLPHISNDDKKLLLIKRLAKSETYYGSFIDDAEFFCENSKRLDFEYNVRCLDRLIETHEAWITGLGKVEFNDHLALKKPYYEISDIYEFIGTMLVYNLNSNSSVKIAATTKSFVNLLCYFPSNSNKYFKYMETLNWIGKSFFLNIINAVIYKESSVLLTAQSFIEDAYKGDMLTHKYESFLIFQNYKRLTGEELNEPIEYLPPDVSKITNIRYDNLLEVEGEKRGSAYFSRGDSFIVKTLKTLQEYKIVTDEEYQLLVSSFSLNKYITDKESLSFIYGNSHFHGDIPLALPLDNHKLLKELINEMFSKGHFASIPLNILIQFFALKEDSYYISYPCKVFSDDSLSWKCGYDLTKTIEENKEVIKQELSLISSYNLPASWVCVGSCVKTYSDKYEVTFSEVSGFLLSSNPFQQFEYLGTFYGNTSSFFIPDRGLPALYFYESEIPFTIFTGGGGFVADANMMVYPSIFWEEFGWKPDTKDPFKWYKDGELVAYFEKIINPDTSSTFHMPYYFRPSIDRWVCKKSALEELEEKVNRPIITQNNLKIDPV